MSDPRPAGSTPLPPGPPAPVSLGKGRPTLKRSDKERRSGPVAPPPRTRKEAATRMREQQALERKGRRSGAGVDPDRLMARDRGPVRAAVRDVVDRRRNIGVLLLPLAVLLVAAQLVGDDRVLRIATSVWTAGLLAVVIDMALLGLRVRSTVRSQFPDEGRTLRHVGYAVLRSTVFRRFRMPPPLVAPGGVAPDGAEVPR